MHKPTFHPPAAIYLPEEWTIAETAYRERLHQRGETIFALGNGYIGMRGNFEEGFQGTDGGSVNGTYINGFYDSEPIVYPEGGFGYAKRTQTMLNVTDAKGIAVYVDGERFGMHAGTVRAYRRELDMRSGTLVRTVTWESPSGRVVRIVFRRLVSLTRKHLAVHAVEVVCEDGGGPLAVAFASTLNGEVVNEVAEKDDPRLGAAMREPALLIESGGADGTRAWLLSRTRSTGFRLAAAVDHCLLGGRHPRSVSALAGGVATVRMEVELADGETAVLTKYAAYHASREDAGTALTADAFATLDAAASTGFAALLAEQRGYLDGYWHRADVRIEGDLALQQGMRYNAFGLLQSVGRDGWTNIGAKGLTGEGYEGHYFWDTETFILPSFLYTAPVISRSLLEYRYHTLDQARARAREMAQKGALYPWRTINGEETSAYYPAGTAQAHINADIVHALRKYVEATDDMDFLLRCGAEMAFETARFWADLGHFNPRRDGRFCIDGVTGPDEYTAVVNNNAYTNLMARENLAFAAETARWMRREHEAAYRALAGRIGLADAEIELWEQAADRMFVPVDEELGIVAQDDTFLTKKRWDFAATPADRYPLLLHYHPLVIYRHQVLKQADVVLALFLLGEQFSLADKIRNYDYYEALTTHDSSLSPCTHSIMAAEIGRPAEALDYFMRTVRMDLDDLNGNVADGLHTASMAGARLSLVNGFAGMRDADGTLHFRPIVPESWTGYGFRVTYRGRLLDVQVARERTTYRLLEGEPLTVLHFGVRVDLAPGRAAELDMRPKLEAVVFDLDGVITDTAEYHYQAWKLLADELQLPFDRTVNERLKGVGRMESLEILLSLGPVTMTPEEKAELAARKNRFYGTLIERVTPGDLLPGVAPLLRELRAAGIRIALASASRNALAILRRLRLEDAFDAVVDPGSLRKGKPDPEIFLAAAETLGVRPAHCIGIEDAAAGIAAIRAAGMTAVGVGSSEQLADADFRAADTSALSIAQLREWFAAKHGLPAIVG